MADNPYTVLGVPQNASQDDIRAAYRKLAKELHPDLRPGDTAAEERFKAVSAAYAILGDADKRARFDKGEIDASGQERPEPTFYREYAGADPSGRYRSTAGHEDFEDISDLFEGLFGQRRAGGGGKMRGRDRRYHLDVDFLEAANGARKRITLPAGGSLDLTIPAGVQNGANLRLKGKGDPGVGGGPPGDALVEISVTPHPTFSRDGDDIRIELPIGLDEAVLGGRVETPTISGRVAVTVPKGSNTGDVLRLKGQGIRRKGGAGDQFVTLKVMLPDDPDPDLEALMKTWRENKRHDPRAKGTES